MSHCLRVSVSAVDFQRVVDVNYAATRVELISLKYPYWFHMTHIL